MMMHVRKGTCMTGSRIVYHCQSASYYYWKTIVFVS